MPLHHADGIYQGLRFLRRGDWRGARAAWQTALQNEPKNARVGELLHAMDRVLPTRVGVPAVTQNEPWAGPSQTAPVEVRSEGPGMWMLAPQPVPAAANPQASASVHNVLRLQGRLHDLLALHDFSGALDVAETLLKTAPGYAPALRARNRCRETLQQMYESRLGSIKRIPRVLVRAEEIPWLDLDPRAGFVLSQVDGVSSYEEIRDISGLDNLEALRVLTKLLAEHVIGS